MPEQRGFLAETADWRARRRRCRHTPALVLHTDRHEAIEPYVIITEHARCGACSAPIYRVKRYGPGSDGDTGWLTSP